MSLPQNNFSHPFIHSHEAGNCFLDETCRFSDNTSEAYREKRLTQDYGEQRSQISETGRPKTLRKTSSWPEVYFCFSERLNIHTDNGQTIYKSKILTYNLQQRAQEARLLSIATSPRGQTAVCRNQSRRPNVAM